MKTKYRKQKGLFLVDTLWACTLLAFGSLLFCQHWAVLVRLLARQKQVEQASASAVACLYHKEYLVDGSQGFTMEAETEATGLGGICLRKVTVYGTGEKRICTFARFEKE